MKKLKSIFALVKQKSPILYWVVIIHLLFAVVAIAGLLIDDRTLLGVNVWLKPLKFAISIAIYIMTLGYLVELYPFSMRKKNIIRNLTSWTLLIEFLIIFFQGARGVQSHYNQSSLFDGVLFGVMGLLVAINVLTMVFMAIETFRLKLFTERSVQWAIALGWIVIIAGSWVGGQMISQLSHNVGVADGGAGLPLVNWSTVAGDLRVAHFFGLHGLQIIPLFAWWLSKKWHTKIWNQILVTLVFGLGYAAWIGYTFYQAKQAMPLLNL